MRLALALAALLVAVPVGAENFIGNGRFHQFRDNVRAVSVPTGGAWFPEGYRIAPGPGTAQARVFVMPPTVSDGYGLGLYVKFDNYNPFAEAGQSWLEHHVFEYDAIMLAQTVVLTWWQKVDSCCVGVVPMLMVNYRNGDYEFFGGGGHYLVSQRDVTDLAGYKARLQAAPYCLATTQWQQCAVRFALPSGLGHATDNNRYILVNLNFRGPTAPGIAVAHLELR